MNTEEVIGGPWYFRMDLANQGIKQGWSAKNVDLRDWQPVTIPHHFGGQPLDLPGTEGWGWYRVRLNGTREASDERWILHFEGVNYRSEVWVNGRPVGSHEHGGYTPFELDITAALNNESSQSIAILVDNVRRSDRCPGKVFAWRNIGGIHRQVKLIKVVVGRVESVRLFDTGDAPGPIRVSVDCRIGGTGVASVLLRGPKLHGKPLGMQISRRVKIDQSGHGEARIPGKYRWSPDTPHLFDVTVELHQGQQRIERRRFATGFRTVSTRKNQFLLNGKRCWVNGMNYLPDVPVSGMLVDLPTLEADLGRIKSMGANTIRAHFAMHRRAYQLCDELGLMVWHDVPLYWWHDRDGLPWGAGDMAAFDAMRPQIRELIDYDFNHPSVVMRIMANECGFYTESSQSAMREICRESKRSDPTRLTAICAYVQQDEGIDLGVDAILCNFYREHQDKTIAALPDEVRPTVERLQQVAKRFPDKPIFVSEVGFEGASNLRGDTYSSEDFQAAALEEYWKQLTRTRALCGFCFWCWADYRYIESKPWGDAFRSASPSLGCWGVVSEDRRYVKVAFEVVRKLFQATRVRRPSRRRSDHS